MKKIKLGIFGMNRGSDNFESILTNDAEITSICDFNPKMIERSKKMLGEVKAFCDFDEFLASGIDAVYLANYFPDHARFAIKALEKGVHVISECTAACTMAECVALVRAAEKSTALYMLGENYPYMDFNRENTRVYQGGTLGKVLFAEGEYNHPSSEDNLGIYARYYDSDKHWRNFLPATYYITHSLGPLMMATHSNPVRVTALPIWHPHPTTGYSASRVGDNTAIITTLNDDDSVYRVTAHAQLGAHENSYRICGTKGQIENVRGTEYTLLRYNEWDIPEGMKETNLYDTPKPTENAELIKRAGHGGSDYFMFRDFFDCIKTGRKPYLDVYVATRMSAVGILAHRSLMKYGEPYDIPDFRKEEDRVKYENDTLTPFYGVNGEEPTLPCSSRPWNPTPEMLARFNDATDKDW